MIALRRLVSTLTETFIININNNNNNNTFDLMRFSKTQSAFVLVSELVMVVRLL